MPVIGKSATSVLLGAGGGPLTSIALAATQAIAGDGAYHVVAFDTVEASSNLVTGVPTVPADGVYWVNGSAYLQNTGHGLVRAVLRGSTTGDLVSSEQTVSAGSVNDTLGVTRRIALVKNETLSLAVSMATGTAGTVGGAVDGTYLQFWS